MYTFSNRLKIGSVILMALGLMGMAIGFISAPSTVEEAKAMVSASHDDGHGGGHEAAAQTHETTSYDSTTEHGAAAQDADHSLDHDEHLLHQLQNRPWSAIYIAAFFFFMLALGTLAFYAVQRAAQAGWSPLLFRVMEGITAYLVPGGIAIFVILVLSVLHMNHLFVWMDAETVAHDELLQGKAGYLNPTFFLIRAAVFLGGWIAYREVSRRLSLAQDEANDNSNFIKNFRWSAGFLVFYLVTESIMSWDWIMSVDPHWFSTLFGWYVFASMFVSGITTIALVTIYLKSRGYLPDVNDSHIHDLGKFMFGISIFWTYLWFGQFMLIWYADIPEEVTYFVTRIEDFKLPFFGMVAMNFLFPLLVLMNSDYKRINWFVVMTGIVVLLGHYLDVYLMITPATVGDQWYIGVPEIGAVLFFGGAFIFWIFRAMTKAPLQPTRNPFIEESRQFHY
ncbi:MULTISPECIES: quinol:cytochrome C oxidoreductase [Robiginitalea]|uniref:quinol:cytochrome C oxidoreductase n=1 Tax=Robiginitalea TaxID=252306 RepID=UPI00234A28D4|nr:MULTISPECIES: quinol:cytochrome C oxidoreductase [unclassified Robiginitalea]MDC6354425.1 quinol:cytochrome C oxidoreductase [Robiginitalea sp. PM2]MDC6374893.1 quinol:cytochrome C oxidoreductase [Robiginitalea sp. SP8]